MENTPEIVLLKRQNYTYFRGGPEVASRRDIVEQINNNEELFEPIEMPPQYEWHQYYFSGCGIGCSIFSLGLFFLILINVIIIPNEVYSVDGFTVKLGCLSGLILILGVGFAHIQASVNTRQKEKYIDGLADNMIHEHKIAIGEIFKVQMDGGPGSPRTIHYRFRHPETDRVVSGSVKTLSPNQTTEGKKVAVLYLTHRIHVLL